MSLSANYAVSCYGAIVYAVRKPATIIATTGDALTVSDGNAFTLLQPVNIFVSGFENRVATIHPEKRDFTA